MIVVYPRSHVDSSESGRHGLSLGCIETTVITGDGAGFGGLRPGNVVPVSSQ